MTTDAPHPEIIAARKIVDSLVWSYASYVGYSRSAETRIDPLTDTPENVQYWERRAHRMQEIADGLRDDLTKALDQYANTIAKHAKETP